MFIRFIQMLSVKNCMKILDRLTVALGWVGQNKKKP